LPKGGRRCRSPFMRRLRIASKHPQGVYIGGTKHRITRQLWPGMGKILPEVSLKLREGFLQVSEFPIVIGASLRRQGICTYLMLGASRFNGARSATPSKKSRAPRAFSHPTLQHRLQGDLEPQERRWCFHCRLRNFSDHISQTSNRKGCQQTFTLEAF
jgi:hypothetical protein